MFFFSCSTSSSFFFFFSSRRRHTRFSRDWSSDVCSSDLQCSVCDDEGVISNWEDSAFDLRRRQLTLAEPVSEIVIPDEVAAALRGLQLLDTDCERLVFRIRAHNDHAILAAAGDDLDELIGFVAAEANHEPNRR